MIKKPNSPHPLMLFTYLNRAEANIRKKNPEIMHNLSDKRRKLHFSGETQIGFLPLTDREIFQERF